MPTVLFTGFPGFLGSALLPRVLRREEDLQAVCVVQDRFLEPGPHAAGGDRAGGPGGRGAHAAGDGDITAPDLGLGAERDALAADTVEVWHLAAVYDLSVPRALAMKPSTWTGRQHVVDYCQGLHRTCGGCSTSPPATSPAGGPASSARADLELGPAASTTSTRRPSTSPRSWCGARWRTGSPRRCTGRRWWWGTPTTGATQKYDGPYFLIRWLLRQPGPFALVPSVGSTSAFRFNCVPRDFVARRHGRRCRAGRTRSGSTFALADPHAARHRRLHGGHRAGLRASAASRCGSPPTWRRSRWAGCPGVHALTGIPASSVPYFTHPTHYDTRATRSTALAESGVVCPPFASYVDALVSFVKDHSEFTSKAMV